MFSRASRRREQDGGKDGSKGGFENREKDRKDREETQIQCQEQDDILEAALGFEMLSGNEERLGYLVNLTTVPKAKDPSSGRVESSVDCYFVSMDSTMFKVRIPYAPYFYIQAKESMLMEVEGMLLKQFEDKIKSVKQMQRGDLDLRNHLMGLRRKVLRVSFHTVSDLIGVRDFVRRIAVRNRTKKSSQNSGRVHESNGSQDPWDAIEDLREYDVPYHQRFSIDKEIYCGCWYTVSLKGGRAQLRREHDLVYKAEPKICAFDIETTKLPMRFPNAESDQVFMISYMLDKQGFLIINREIVSEDISAFEYTPKPDFIGQFTVFNEKDEKALLRRWFDHMREVQPSIYVTYNGDFFDWPFLDKRAEKHGLNMKQEIGFAMNSANECISRCCPHLDCLYWVNRDSYLPQGSRGLKNVTKVKLGYNPVEVDPEKMVDMARTDPQSMASYSVSDAVATYYLYMVYIHPFVFSLATIIPNPPDEVLRKGSGTLCEALLMVKAFENEILFPNKHDSQGISYSKGHVLESETYIGGKVEGCECGVFRADIPLKFQCRPGHVQGLIDRLDQDLKYALEVEGKKSLEQVENYEEVKGNIQAILEDLRDRPVREEHPLIYHLDVAAMYPNIILTNRLQPTAIVTNEDCAACDFNKPNKTCLRKMNWVWRGEHFPAERDEVHAAENRLAREKFCWRGKNDVLWEDLPVSEQTKYIKEKLKAYCRKVYKRMKDKPVTETREAGICMRENSFYVDTVQEFRDRRYEYKGKTKKWKGVKEAANKSGDKAKASEASDMVVLYDSLQLAHKCILNSFYGYVMRKGARWYSMEMAGVVTHTGANIIQDTREIVEGIGRPLELDTDGIWCALPKSFPEEFKFKLKDGKEYKISYPCVILNTMVAKRYKNEQYQRLLDPSKHVYQTSTTMSIEFEVDGPYQAMVLPASQEEGKSIKKRYAVFNLDGSLAELKGFEIKRRGELQLIKDFQANVFKEYLKGKTLQECYKYVAKIADRYLDIVEAKGWTLSDEEVLYFIMESCTMSKSMDDYGGRKSMAITCASRLASFLHDERLKEKGLTCRYIVSLHPQGKSTTERVIPIQIFQTTPSIAHKYLTEWCGQQGLGEDPDVMPNMRNIIDWDYYRERLSGSIQKIITIPAELQGIRNPVPRVVHPNWLSRRVRELQSKLKQKSITSMLAPEAVAETKEVMDIEDLGTEPESHPPMDETEPEPEPHGGAEGFVTDEVDKEEEHNEGRESDENVCEDVVKEDISNPRAFIRHAKRKWRAQLDARKVSRTSKAQATPRGAQGQAMVAERQPMQARNLGEFVRGHQQAVRDSDWHVVQVMETGTPGLLRVWAVANSSLFSFQLSTPKHFYIASDTKLEGRTPLKKHLPPSVHAAFVYQESCSQEEYMEVLKRRAMELAPVRASIHEDRLPDWLSIGIGMSCVVTLAPHAKDKDYSQGLVPEDLQSQLPKESSYLDGKGAHGLGLLHPILISLAKSSDDRRAVFAVVYPSSGGGELVVVDSAAEPRSNETSILVNSMWRQEAGGSCHESLQDMDFTIHVVGSTRDALAEVNRAVSRAKERASGPTVSLISSSKQLIRSSKLPILREMPCIDMWSGDTSKTDYTDPQWRLSATRAAFSQCLKSHRGIQQRVEEARYCNLPVGICAEHSDWLRSAADVLFARNLRSADHILWAVDNSLPDCAVHRSIHADEYYKDEMDKTELLYPGVYRTVCVELRVYHMEVSAIINAGLLYHAQGVIGSRWMRVVSDLVRKWANDACNSSNRGPNGLVNRFCQWMSNPESKMYHPEIKRQLDQVILSMLSQAVSELRKLEVNVVKVDCTSFIIATGKQDIAAANEYLECILQTIGSQELFSWLVMKPTKMWHSLIFKDSFNYHGIEAKEDSSPTADPVLRYHWNLKDFLPRVVQIPFVSAISEFIVRPYHNMMKKKHTGSSQDFQMEAGRNAANASAMLREYLQHDLKTHFITSLGEIVLKLLNCVDDILEEDAAFPTPPGSHLSEKELGSVSVAFVRNLIQVMSLDACVSEEVEDLNRNLLRLMGLEVCSPEAQFQEPCLTYILKDVICRNCGSCSTLDCCRDTDLVRGQWACQVCESPYEKNYIQKRLMADLAWLNMRFQLQSLKCQKCKQVARSHLPMHCPDCGGCWVCTFSSEEFRIKVLAISHMAEQNGFDAVVTCAQRLLCD